MANEKDNSRILKNKSLEDLKNMARSMGIKEDNSFTRDDYYNFIVYGKLPEKDIYNPEDLKKLNIKDLRNLAGELGIKSAYKFKKDFLIDEILKGKNESPTDEEYDLNKKTVLDLRQIAEELNIEKAYSYKKDELIKLIEETKEISEDEDFYKNDDLDEELESDFYEEEKEEEHSFVADDGIDKKEKAKAKKNGIEIEGISDNATAALGQMDNAEYVCGILELHQDGYGFLRFNNYLPSDGDIYVSPSQIRKFKLRNGDKVKGIVRPSKDGESFNGLIYIAEVNDRSPSLSVKRPYFENLTPLYPRQKITLENSDEDLAMRVIDLICPIGKGQRGLIVSQPKSGKTSLLKKIAKSIEKNYPKIKLFVLLIDERPEEVTDMIRSVKGEVAYSTFDETPKNHTRVAEMVIDRAKRIAEQKEDVVILLDSLTRLSRAYNLITPSSGKTLSGGLDPLSLHKPKRIFGSARNLEEGGSLTILATALIETGSRMDDIIFEEFKGTGNMELHLDRKLSEKRIFPAIDIYKSGTRKEEFLLKDEELNFAYKIRNAMAYNSSGEVTEFLLDELVNSKNNQIFLKKSKNMTFSY
ncbi:transcription termination factor Rho [uncultured Peptoniphilus sp.]|uniref:transcription termination factor Rho n=1 Tax=uncultured Peptoniphilus sp. TaxID=254354 RepID=UPI0028061ABB|nr:transcription termination factor Rho [uncultured Peptoniphilus sp.]